MGCGDGKLSKYLTQTFTAHCNAMICQQVTLSGDAEWPKVADAVIEAKFPYFTLVRRGICDDTQPVVLPDPFDCPRLDLPHDPRLVARLFQSHTYQALQA